MDLILFRNNGEVAGQTVFHFHMHIIPRIKGDTVNVGCIPGTADNDTIASIVEKLHLIFNVCICYIMRI